MSDNASVFRDDIDLNSEKMSILNRIKNLFICPSNLIEHIKSKPNILFPILFMIFFNIGTVFIRFDAFKEAVKNNMMSEFQGSTTAVTDQLINIGVFFAPIMYIVILFVSILISAIVFYAFVKLFKGVGSFKQYVSLVAYSSMVNIVGMLIIVIISIGTGKFLISTDFSILQILNIKTAETYFTMILDKLTLFNLLNLWQFILIALGISKISKIHKKYVYPFTAIVYIISLFLV